MIYLDHNATTPVNPGVFESMVPYLTQHFGNPSSPYSIGHEGKLVLESSRNKVAACIGAEADEIVFTSGGTESNNLAVRGAVKALKNRGCNIITSSVEHYAVLKTVRDLEKDGFGITYVPVDSRGVVDPGDVKKNITSQTILISIMHANNETGAVQPIEEIGAIAREKNIVFHTDAIQAAGKIPVDVNRINADLLSVSAHKIYGPKGVGALYIRKGTPVSPVLTGGHHEYGLRAGTENIAGIVGFAEALTLAAESLLEESKRIECLRDRLEKKVAEEIKGVHVNSVEALRLPNTTSINFRAIEAESILLHLDLKGICASSGSACTMGSSIPSHVLLSMGLDLRAAQGAVRFSLGKDNTEDDIDATVEALVEITDKLRKISSI